MSMYSSYFTDFTLEQLVCLQENLEVKEYPPPARTGTTVTTQTVTQTGAGGLGMHWLSYIKIDSLLGVGVGGYAAMWPLDSSWEGNNNRRCTF